MCKTSIPIIFNRDMVHCLAFSLSKLNLAAVDYARRSIAINVIIRFPQNTCHFMFQHYVEVELRVASSRLRPLLHPFRSKAELSIVFSDYRIHQMMTQSYRLRSVLIDISYGSGAKRLIWKRVVRSSIGRNIHRLLHVQNLADLIYLRERSPWPEPVELPQRQLSFSCVSHLGKHGQ